MDLIVAQIRTPGPTAPTPGSAPGSGLQPPPVAGTNWLEIAFMICGAVAGLALVWIVIRQLMRGHPEEGTEGAPLGALTFPTEWAASAAAAALNDHGIDAQVAGGFAAGNRAEAPGMVSVLVAPADLEDAEVVVAGLRAEQDEYDWDTIDVGPAPDETDDCPACGYTLNAGRSADCPECGWQRT